MTSLRQSDLRSLLSDYGVAPDELCTTPLDGGGRNSSVLLEVDGRKLVLRLYQRAAIEAAEFELELACFLTRNEFGTQPPLKRTNGAFWHEMDGQPAALFEFIEGEEPVPGSRETALPLASAVARMHLLTRSVEMPNARAWTDLAALDRLNELVTSIGEQVNDALWPELVEDCRELSVRIALRVLPHDDELPKGIIHHDLHPGNVLLDSHHEITLLDFDEAQFAWLGLDIASLIRYWGMDDEWEHIDPARVRGLIGAYQSQRPLLDIENELLPEMLLVFLLGDALGFILPALTRDPSSSAVTDSNAYRRFRVLKSDLARDGALLTPTA